MQIHDGEKQSETTVSVDEVDLDLQAEENEARERLQDLEKRHGATWNGIDDPEDPFNWPAARKISIAIIISIGQLVTLMSASIVAAALGDIARDLNIDPSTSQLTFSSYYLGLAFGPCFIAAISEMNGRRNIWLASNIWFILWNTLCPVGKSKGLLISGRILAALGASVGITSLLTVLSTKVADMYPSKYRGRSLALASLLSYLGPALGPIIGGLLTQLLAWPYLFYVVSIFNAVITFLGFFIVKESYTPVLLQRKRAKQSMSEGHDLMHSKTSTWAARRDIASRFWAHFTRPFAQLIQRPIVQVISFSLALEFGIYSLVLSTYATLWTDRYGQSQLISSLHYISISIGTTASAQAGGRFLDYVYRRLRRRNNGIGKPEFRAPCMVPAALLIPTGLLLYGWSAQHRLYFIAVDIGAAIFTCGAFMFTEAVLAYLLDEFTEHGASANAASRSLSYILGFVFPLFAPQLYDRLEYGWGNSVLTLVWVVLGFPIPVLLWLFGEKLRAKGRKD
ncbi:major facilitator superfamily domain-containing protein [Xylaria flabelliformis]|nr:major facilitator superfamily domain-containing protein [Xylaria flabelliformis]